MLTHHKIVVLDFELLAKPCVRTCEARSPIFAVGADVALLRDAVGLECSKQLWFFLVILTVKPV